MASSSASPSWPEAPFGTPVFRSPVRTSSALWKPTVDIGLAQLAMHSCYETAAVSDAIDLETAMAAYYGSTLEATESGFSIL